MKTKILEHFVAIIVIALSFSSCKKEAANHASEQVASTENNLTSNSAADTTMMHFRVDVTGLTFHNDCTNEDMVITSGVFNLNTHQNGTVASYNVQHFVLQGADGSIYHGNWVGTFTLNGSESGPGTITNSYKAIFTTSGGGNNSVLVGLFHITSNANGQITVVIDNFTAGCQ